MPFLRVILQAKYITVQLFQRFLQLGFMLPFPMDKDHLVLLLQPLQLAADTLQMTDLQLFPCTYPDPVCFIYPAQKVRELIENFLLVLCHRLLPDEGIFVCA